MATTNKVRLTWDLEFEGTAEKVREIEIWITDGIRKAEREKVVRVSVNRSRQVELRRGRKKKEQ